MKTIQSIYIDSELVEKARQRGRGFISETCEKALRAELNQPLEDKLTRRMQEVEAKIRKYLVKNEKVSPKTPSKRVIK